MSEPIRVCIVEDDEDVVRAVEMNLRREPDIQVMPIPLLSDPERLDDVERCLVEANPSVVIVDLGLPWVEEVKDRWEAGLRLLKRFSEAGLEAVPLVLTAYADNREVMLEAYRVGAGFVVHKTGPQTYRELRLWIRLADAHYEWAKERRELDVHRELVKMAAQLAHDLTPLGDIVNQIIFEAEQGQPLTPQSIEMARMCLELHDSRRRWIMDSCSGGDRERPFAVVAWTDAWRRVELCTDYLNRKFNHVAQLDVQNTYDGLIDCDCDGLERALQNLVYNALKALFARYEGQPRAGRLRVQAAARADALVVEIEDDAGGLPQDASERGGLGLGISREIVERHHGSLEIESREGQGTLFRLTIPFGSPERLDEGLESAVVI